MWIKSNSKTSGLFNADKVARFAVMTARDAGHWDGGDRSTTWFGAPSDGFAVVGFRASGRLFIEAESEDDANEVLDDIAAGIASGAKLLDFSGSS